MSTKIYDGFVLTINNFERLNKEIIAFRKDITPIVNKGYWHYLATISSNFIDNKLCNIPIDKEDKETTPYFYAEHNLRNDITNVERTQQRDPWVDFETSLVFIPYNKKIFGIIYSEQKNIREMWFNKKFVKEYGYWDNTDRPEKISNKSWKLRGDIWDKILSNFNYIPSMNGFTAECVAKWYTYDIHNFEEIIKLIPSFEDRVYRIARNQLYDNFNKKHNKNNKDGFYTSWKKFEEWLKGKGKEKLEDKKVEITNKLKIIKTITKDILINDLKIVKNNA